MSNLSIYVSKENFENHIELLLIETENKSDLT